MPDDKPPITLGPTGEFPYNEPLTPYDRGGCVSAVRIMKNSRHVMMEFGTIVTWLAVTPQEAIDSARVIRSRINEAFGLLSYDVTGLPFRIIANREKNIVETHFPIGLEVLVANPELFLAWSQRLEEAGTALVGGTC